VVAEGVRTDKDKRVRDGKRLVCKRKYVEVDVLINFETMERFENRRDMTGSRSRDYSAGQAVLDLFWISEDETRVEFEEGQSRVSYSSQVRVNKRCGNSSSSGIVEERADII
jgi:hypothetical protein